MTSANWITQPDNFSISGNFKETSASFSTGTNTGSLSNALIRDWTMGARLALNLKWVIFEIINNKARHNLIYAKCRWRSDQLDGAGSFSEPLGQTKVMQICQRETQNHQGAITHEIYSISRQLFNQTAAGSLRFEVTSLLSF